MFGVVGAVAAVAVVMVFSEMSSQQSAGADRDHESDMMNKERQWELQDRKAEAESQSQLASEEGEFRGIEEGRGVHEGRQEPLN